MRLNLLCNPLLCLVASIILPLHAQDFAPPAASPDTSAPTLSVITRTVALDVIAKDAKGQPIHGLKQSDFTVLEDGKPQRITSFEEHVADTAPPLPPLHLPPNTFSNYVPNITPGATATVILLNAPSAYTATGNAYAFEQVLSFLRSTTPGSPMAIFLVHGLTLNLLQGFTTDPEVLAAALKSKRAMPNTGGRFADHRYYVMNDDMITGGLPALARYLAGIPGRKNLIWFTHFGPGASSGIDRLFPDSSEFVDEMNHSTDLLRLSRVSVYTIDEDGVTAYRHPYYGDQFDPLSQATGGKSFYSTNGLKAAMQEIVTAGANFYTLAYTPSSANWDGSFRTLNITTNNPAITLEYRNGYFADNRDAEERAHLLAARAGHKLQPIGLATAAPSPGLRRRNDPVVKPSKLHAAMIPGTLPATELLFVARVTPSKKTEKFRKNAPLPPDDFLRSPFNDRETRDYEVFFATHIDAIHFARSANGLRHGKVDFISAVYADGAQIVNTLESSITLDLSDSNYDYFQQHGLTITQHIEVPAKGNYFLRVGVRDVASDSVGAMEIPLDRTQPVPPQPAEIP